MFKAVAVAAIVALVAAWSHYYPLHVARQAAASRLIDPGSAQFRGVRIDGGIACGEINGKNRMGAYTGFQPFAAILVEGEASGAWLASDGPELARLIAESCK